MKILSVSHSCVVSEYQKRMTEVARYSDIKLSLLVPKYWFQFNEKVKLEKISDACYRIISVQPVTWGWRDNRLQNLTHIYPSIKRILEAIRPDIIELWEEPFSAVAAHTTFWAKRTIPWTKIIFFSAQNVLKKYPPPFSVFEKYTYKNARYAFLMNDEVARVLRKKGYDGEYRVLPLGVDAEVFCKKDVSSLKGKLGLREFVVGFVGKITRQKGIFDLIEAVSQINERIQLLIIGNGDLKENVRHLIKISGLKQRTVLMDAIPHSQIPGYLNCMDILVFPSITLPKAKEQFGRVLVEAMACQVSVIGSNSGEIPRIIKNAGLTFRERDVEDLREKIVLLIKNEALRKRIAENGYKKVMDNYTWEKIAEKQYAVYRELMREIRL